MKSQKTKQKLLQKISAVLMGVLVAVTVLAFGVPGIGVGTKVAKASGDTNYTINVTPNPLTVTVGSTLPTLSIQVNLTDFEQGNNLTNINNATVLFFGYCDETKADCDASTTNSNATLKTSDPTHVYQQLNISDNKTVSNVYSPYATYQLSNVPGTLINSSTTKIKIGVGIMLNGSRVYDGAQLDVPVQAVAPSTSQLGSITVTYLTDTPALKSDPVTQTITANVVTSTGSQHTGYNWSWQVNGQALDSSKVTGDPTSGQFLIALDSKNWDPAKSYIFTATATAKDPSLQQPNGSGSVTVPPLPSSSAPLAASSVSGNGTCSTITGGIMCIIQMTVTAIVGILRTATLFIFTLIVAPVMQAILGIQPHDVSFAAVILPGWVVIRNLMNIFFILMLIIMSIGTLFNINSLSYKHLLGDIVLMAILVNFSLTICQVILGIADTFQAQFLPANGQVLGYLATQLIGGQWANQFSNIFAVGGSWSGIITELVGLLFAVGALAVFAAITVYLLIRVVALWILMMISPLFVGLFGHTPLHHEAQKFSNMFLKYAFFTPVMALFLHLCALIAQAQSTFVSKDVAAALISSNAVVQGAAAQGSVTTNFQSFILNVLSNVLTIGCLWFTLELAHEFSIAGANKIGHWAEHATIMPFEKGGEYALRQRNKLAYRLNNLDNDANRNVIQRFASKWASRAIAPEQAWHARAHRIEEENEYRKKLSEAGFHRRSEYLASGKTIDTRADHKVKNEHYNNFAKNWEDLNGQELWKQFSDIHAHGDSHIEAQIGVIVAAINGDKYKDMAKAYVAQKTGQKIDDVNLSRSDVKGFIESVAGSNMDAARIISTKLESAAKKNKDFEFMGHAKSENGSYRLATDTEQWGAMLKAITDLKSEMMKEGKFSSGLLYQNGERTEEMVQILDHMAEKLTTEDVLKSTAGNTKAFLSAEKVTSDQNGNRLILQVDNVNNFQSAYLDKSGNVRSKYNAVLQELINNVGGIRAVKDYRKRDFVVTDKTGAAVVFDRDGKNQGQTKLDMSKYELFSPGSKVLRNTKP